MIIKTIYRTYFITYNIRSLKSNDEIEIHSKSGSICKCCRLMIPSIADKIHDETRWMGTLILKFKNPCICLLDFEFAK
jgi:hypothetical protein